MFFEVLGNNTLKKKDVLDEFKVPQSQAKKGTKVKQIEVQILGIRKVSCFFTLTFRSSFELFRLALVGENQNNQYFHVNQSCVQLLHHS